MNYHFSTTLKGLNFDEAIEKTKAALKDEGFGILTEIDIKQTLKDKLDEDFRPYRILGACNPPFAHKALQAESHIGLMLPCNVVVQQKADDEIEVSAVDPVASMQAVENKDLAHIATEVQERLKKAVESLH